MHVLFVEPSFPRNQPRFVRALAEVGARVTGIGEAPVSALPDSVTQSLYGYEQVGSVCDEDAMTEAVRRIQAREWVDRLEATVEAHILPTARVRADCGIPGTSIETAYLCRDKPAMKEALRRAGVPCAQSAGVASPEEAREFAARVGFPFILKPRSGAGAAGTFKVSSEAELEAALGPSGLERGVSVAAEEFIEGHEAFYDTLTIDGEIVFDFISHYYPGVLEAMRTRWISPYFLTTNRVETESYAEVKAMGRRVIGALGIGTSPTHMEWFFGPKGLKFSEIGCRPPGVGGWDLYCAGNDMDLYREWAMAIVHGRCEARPSRRFSAGILNLRPERDGRISGYSGLAEIEQRFGEWIIDSHLPPPGTPTQPVDAGYMANAWIRMRHPDYDRLREMLETVARTVHVYTD
ncbi:MAG: ATP-grasp domain-containing protein [Acidobacteriota bacterium]|nr:ATP-grasp domain-containing protein [Acidobacteriota bacterium]